MGVIMSKRFTKKFKDEIDFIMAFEDEQLDIDEIAEGFQQLIDNGHVWSLQGFYGRTAASLIEAGYCHR